MKNILMVILEVGLLAVLCALLLQTNMIKETLSITIPKTTITYTLSVSMVVIIGYFIGLFAGLLHSVVSSARYKNLLKQYEKRTEKLSLQNEINTDDTEVLKRKIASLEIALENALKNK